MTSGSIIGPGTLVTGDIESEDDLTIEGRVEGAIRTRGCVTIERGGMATSSIAARNATVAGELHGDVEAEETVRIADGGSVVGDITAPRVVLEDGAVFRGSIDMSAAQVTVPAPPRAHGATRKEQAPQRSRFELPLPESTPPPAMVAAEALAAMHPTSVERPYPVSSRSFPFPSEPPFTSVRAGRPEQAHKAAPPPPPRGRSYGDAPPPSRGRSADTHTAPAPSRRVEERPSPPSPKVRVLGKVQALKK